VLNQSNANELAQIGNKVGSLVLLVRLSYSGP